MPTIPQDMLDVYFSKDGDESPERAAKHEAARLLRGISNGLLWMDTDAADASPVVEALREVEQRLAELPRRDRSPARTRSGDGRLVERSPLSGIGNPIAPPLDLRFEDGRAIATAVFDERYEGPPGHVHGGIIAAAFDEILGVGQIGSGQVGPTGELTIRLHRPTPLHREVEFSSWVAEHAGRKVTVKAVVRCDDEVLAEATGLFISAR